MATSDNLLPFALKAFEDRTSNEATRRDILDYLKETDAQFPYKSKVPIFNSLLKFMRFTTKPEYWPESERVVRLIELMERLLNYRITQLYQKFRLGLMDTILSYDENHPEMVAFLFTYHAFPIEDIR